VVSFDIGGGADTGSGMAHGQTDGTGRKVRRDASTTRTSGAATSLGDGGARRVRAVGLPRPDDAPELVALLDDLERLDGLHARVVEQVARLQASHESELVTGLPVETWLLAAGMPRADRRMLATAVTQLDRLPSVARAFADGTVSWAQVRAVALAVARLSEAQVAIVDDELAPLLARQAHRDPDELAVIVTELVASLTPQVRTDDADTAERDRFLSFQPRLDGTGARVYGDLDGLGYGLVAAALDAGMPLTRRHGHIGATADPATRRTTARAAGTHRADRLVQLATDDLARRTGTPLHPDRPLTADTDATDATEGTDGIDGTDGTEGTDGAGGHQTVDRTRALAPQVTLLLTLDQLLGDDTLPVDLLAPVTGGRLKVSTPTARHWLDQAGGRLRTIVLDQTGRTLGVGRRRRFAPAWIRDAIEATHTTCCAPGCQTAVRICDIDHHTPWTPPPHTTTATPGEPDGSDRPGRTDLDQLGPLCRACHTAKDHGWTITTHPDSTRRWHHPRTGLTIDTTPHAQLDTPARHHRTTGGPRPSGADPPT
jgi:hypothetical protein